MSDDIKEVDVLDAQYPLMILSKEKTPGTHLHEKNVSSLLDALAVKFGTQV